MSPHQAAGLRVLITFLAFAQILTVAAIQRVRAKDAPPWPAAIYLILAMIVAAAVAIFSGWVLP